MKLKLHTALQISSFIWPIVFSGIAHSSIQFEETTTQAGISYVGESWGIAWGDYNGDGLPDIWSGNHRMHPSLYVNNGDGTFTDVLPGMFSGNAQADTHGVAWADYDNDGDQDLVEVTGGSTSTNINHFNHLYNNDGGNLTDVAVQLGVDYPENRGRTPLWLDYNNDGLLDLVTAGSPRNGIAPSRIFKQSATGFSDSSNETGFNCVKDSNLALLSDLSGNGVMDLICHEEIFFPQKIYDISTSVFSNIISLVPTVNFVGDVVLADFNGDLRPDIFTARFPPNQSNTIQVDTNTIESTIKASSIERGFEISTSGVLSIDISTPFLEAGWLPGTGPVSNEIYIGDTGWNPSRLIGKGVNRAVFSISSDDPTVHGIKPRQPGENGLFIGYDPTEGKWSVILFGGNRFQVIWAQMVSENPVTGITHIGYDPSINNISPIMNLSTGSGFIDATDTSGLSAPINCRTAVAGDFDNDMDLDIYMACQFAPANTPNILFENDGNGNFISILDAGGAAGSSEGIVNNVAIADYDMDGFLDLYLVNGHGEPPLTDGPDQLFRNLGNSNHWIEIDLEGINSNRDGIGTKVLLTAGGVTQLREQNGGIHHAAQNHKRLHFGLGANTNIEEIVLQWPSGTQQTLSDIPVDQVLKITEGVANHSPTISGTPSTTLLQDTSYSFKPTATDPDTGDTLVFSIINKPSWASFDTTTGLLSGTPDNTDVGTTSGITITIDDQQGQLNSTASLQPFNLTVNPLNSNIDTNSSSSGGCSVNRYAKSDPALPLLVAISIICLARRRKIKDTFVLRNLQ